MLLSLFLWQSTEIIAAPTAASATVGGKTVNRSNEFTESGGNVTFPTTSIANGGGISSSVAELVNPKPLEGNGKWFQNLGSTSTPSVNLALNKPVKSSSDENDGKKASYAVDGNTGTAWSSAWTDVASFQVDLITRKTFDKIVIQWETAYSKSFTIQAGNNVDANGDLVDGTVIATVTGQTIDNANNYRQTISVAQTTARYIRFNSSLRGTGYGNSFYEFEVYADQCTTALDPTDVPAVKSVGTDGITAVKALYGQGTAQNGFAFADWGSSTIKSSATVDSKAIDLFNNFTFYGSSYTAFDATLWEKLHVDIYPMDGVSTVAIMPIKEGTGGKGQQFTVTPGQWNSLELDMATLAAAGLDRNGINQIKIGGSLNGDGEMVNANGNGAIYVGNIYYYTTAILPPTTIPSIKTVGTDGITAVKALYNQGSKENGFDFTAWGGHTDPTAATVDGKTISLFSNFSYLGGQYTAFDATQWDKLVIDVYPMTDMTVNVFPINAGNTEYSQQFTPTKGEWTSLEVDLQQLYNSGAGLDISRLNQLKVNGGTGTQQFYVGNIYYYSTQHITSTDPTDVPGIITSFNDGVNNYTIESDQVTKVFTVDGNATGFVFQGPYNSTVQEAFTINGKQAEKFTNFNTAVGAFTEVNISDADYLHVDAYPLENVSLVVYHSQQNQKGQKYNLTAGQWNSIDIPVSLFDNPTATNTFLLTQNMTAQGTETHVGDIANVTLYLGNYYFFRKETVPDTQKPVMATATVSNIGTTTATLTVRATDNKAGNLTYKIYNGSTEGTLLATATGAAGQNTVVNLTGLTQGVTYNLVVTATDAAPARNTSESMAVAFTTLNYIPTLTTIYVRMKGESTDAYNVAKTEPGVAQCTIQIIALDQKGNDMPTRQMRLRIVDGNTGTNDVKLVETENVRTVPKSSEEGSTSIQKFNHVGRVTIEAVDNLTGKTGFGFLTFYDAANTAVTNEDQLISDPAQVASAKITGANESIIRLAADGHGTNNYVTDGTQPAEFVVDWSSIQDNQQHYEYYDIDMIQVLYQQGKFPSDYTIAVSHDGGETYEDVYHYDGTQEFYNPSSNPGFRADAWNASRQLTQAVTHVRFRSNNNDAIAFDAFKVYGKLNSVDDNKAPYDLYADVKVAASTDDANKTSTAQIWIECKDDETAESDYLYYTITSARGMQYTTKGHPRKGDNLNQVIFDFNNTLVPGSHYVFYITASDGRNKTDKKGSSADLMKIEFDTPALVSAPDVDGVVASKASTTATLNYWLPEAANTAVGDDDDIVITVKRGTTVVADATYKKNQVDETHMVALNLERLTPSTTYTYTITATNTVNGLSSEKSLTFTTEAGGSSLEVWFTDGGTHYTGWTGQLEDIISNSSKGNRDVLGVTEIHIEGSLNNEDIMLLRRMAGGATYIGNNSVKQRVFIKADAAPYLYAWKGAEKLLGDFPGRQLTTKTNGGYYVYEFNTDGVSIVINNGTQEDLGNGNNQTKDIALALGNNYFTYNGGNGCEDKTSEGYYGSLATMDLAQAEFYHDGGAYVTRWYANANTPTILNPIGGEFKSSPNIEGYMFMECKNLRTVTVPTKCKEIALNAFYGGTDNDGISLTTINLNEGLEVIAGYAFEKNENLGKVTLPSTLKLIGYNAFCDCHAMTLGNANGQLPNSITDIDNQAFANTSIAEVILPANASYTTVKTNVFGWSRELNKVTIPANVTTLMNGSFRDSKKLATIEDAAANITEIGDEAFMNDIALPSAEVNGLIAHLTTLNNSVFNGCTAVTEVNIPAGVTTLKNLTFANCTNINRVTVNSATAPTGYAVNEGVMRSLEAIPNTNPVEYRLGPSSDPFAAVNANHMTLTFAGAAVGGYKSYRGGSEATVQNNAFRRLLTKTLDESATKYDVAGQMHADVVLKRTMVEGWNTVALPFGVKSGDAEARDRDGITAAGVYQKAFNGDVAENNNFMIAAYRGIDNDVFKFLKYANYEQDPLDEFEPLLIRMGSGNISPSNEYTFEDVDLNYDVEENKLYRDGNAAGEVPVKRWDTESSSFKPFIGNYNREGADAIAPFVNCKDDYAFMGTYTTKTTSDWKKEDGTITYEGGTPYAYTNLPSGYFLTAEDDYIIQGNKFYKVVGTNSYGLRGYRAWFQKQPTTGTARPAQLMFSVMELDGDTPTEIESFDAIDSDVKPFDVYSIGGQLLRKQTKSLNGLPNGIYIVNGRKVAVGK